jgi:hypothetical protein
MATDVAKHFGDLAQFKARIGDKNHKFPDKDRPQDKEMLMKMVVHAADLNNPSRALGVAVKWTYCVMMEFFTQGDRERARDLPVSMFMDRYNTNVPGCQVGFIDTLASPIFSTLEQVYPGLAPCLQRLNYTRAFWSSLIETFADRDQITEEEELSLLAETYAEEHDYEEETARENHHRAVSSAKLAMPSDRKRSVWSIAPPKKASLVP